MSLIASILTSLVDVVIIDGLTCGTIIIYVLLLYLGLLLNYVVLVWLVQEGACSLNNLWARVI